MWSTFSIFGAIFCIPLASPRVETAARAPREATPCPPGSTKRAEKAPPRRPRTLPRSGTGSPRQQHFGLSLSKSLMSAPLPPGPATPAPPPVGPSGRHSLRGLAHASRPANRARRPAGRGRRRGEGSTSYSSSEAMVGGAGARRGRGAAPGGRHFVPVGSLRGLRFLLRGRRRAQCTDQPLAPGGRCGPAAAGLCAGAAAQRALGARAQCPAGRLRLRRGLIAPARGRTGWGGRGGGAGCAAGSVAPGLRCSAKSFLLATDKPAPATEHAQCCRPARRSSAPALRVFGPPSREGWEAAGRGGQGEHGLRSGPGRGRRAAGSKPAGRGGVGRGGRGRIWWWAGPIGVGGAPSCPSPAPRGPCGHGTAHRPCLDGGASCPAEGGTGRCLRVAENGDCARWGR